MSESDRQNSESDDARLKAYLRTFLIPAIFLKGFILYFGLNYSNNPGDGWGWGLVATIVFSFVNFAIFIRRNWNEAEEVERPHGRQSAKNPD